MDSVALGVGRRGRITARYRVLGRVGGGERTELGFNNGGGLMGRLLLLMGEQHQWGIFQGGLTRVQTVLQLK